MHISIGSILQEETDRPGSPYSRTMRENVMSGQNRTNRNHRIYSQRPYLEECCARAARMGHLGQEEMSTNAIKSRHARCPADLA